MRLVWDAENGKPVSPRTHHLLALALGVQPAELLAAHGPRWMSTMRRATIPASVLVAILAGGWGGWAATHASVIDAVRSGDGLAPVRIDSVEFRGTSENYFVEIRGTGFGNVPFKQAFTGTLSHLHVYDSTMHFSAGYDGDEVPLRFIRWSDGDIVVGALPSRAGDCISLFLRNPSTHVSATWGGNIAPLRLGTPKILSAVVAPSGRLAIFGSGFGPPPQRLPFTSNDGYVTLVDAAYQPWSSGHSMVFLIGDHSSLTKLRFTAWSDSSIVVSAFSGALPADGDSIQNGDPIAITVWNVWAARRTAWGGSAI